VAIPPVNTLSLSVNPSSTTSYVLLAANSGCTNSDTVVVSISSPAVANAGPDQSILSGQGINIGGNPTNPGGGSVVWMPNIALTDTSATNPVASPTLTTTYIVVVTNSFGCKARDTMVVTVLPPFDIPNGFTPNGDSKNDTWMLDNLYKFPNAEVEVYNRWGEQLFYSRGNYTPWNGNYNGSPVPVGTYYYIIKLNDKNYPDHYAGPLTILR
jgi:gliding motility-associated-like protein